MDFHAAMETFAEAWVAANAQSAVNAETASPEPTSSRIFSPDDLPTMVPRDQLVRLSHLKTSPVSLALATSPGPGGLMVGDGTTSLGGGGGGGIFCMTRGGVKSMPIHCIVEQMTVGPTCVDDKKPSDPTGILGLSGKNSNGGALGVGPLGLGAPSPVVELDTYAILPGSTLFSEIVRTALLKIGYTASEVVGAKGAIQIKNWKPLSFDTITENPSATLDEILGDLTSFATLRIRLCSATTVWKPRMGISQEKLQEFRALDLSKESLEPGFIWTDIMVRCAVIDLLYEINQSELAKLSPLAQSTISNIANSKYMATIGPEKCTDFGRWYVGYKKEKEAQDNMSDPCKPHNMRMTFHPLQELPKMRKWFETFKAPSEQLFQSFVDEINSGNVRKQRRPVTIRNIKLWWRNEKVRQKKMRQLDGQPCPARRPRGRPKKGSAPPATSASDHPPPPPPMCSPGPFPPPPDTPGLPNSTSASTAAHNSMAAGDDNSFVLGLDAGAGTPSSSSTGNQVVKSPPSSLTSGQDSGGPLSPVASLNLTTNNSSTTSASERAPHGYVSLERHALTSQPAVYPIPYVPLLDPTPRIEDLTAQHHHHQAGRVPPMAPGYYMAASQRRATDNLMSANNSKDQKPPTHLPPHTHAHSALPMHAAHHMHFGN